MVMISSAFVGIQCDQRRRVSAAFINGHHWVRRVADGFAEEAQRCCRIPSGGKQGNRWSAPRCRRRDTNMSTGL